MKKKVVKGEIIIVPNHPYTKQELGWFDIKNWEKWAAKTQSQLDNFDGDISVEEPMIQVWAGNEECDNFSCHFAHYTRMIGVEDDEKDNRFPSHLPYSMLKGLREGDTLTINLKNGVTLELTAAQKANRYSLYGNFEEVLEQLVALA